MFFIPISKVDNETLKLFIPYRKVFKNSGKSAIKQLSKLINKSVAFYKVIYTTGEFKGCLFIYEINHENKTVEFGGFADRKARTFQAIKELIAFINHNYIGYTIISDTKELAAKLCLRKLGFKQNDKGEYYYG